MSPTPVRQKNRKPIFLRAAAWIVLMTFSTSNQFLPVSYASGAEKGTAPFQGTIPFSVLGSDPLGSDPTIRVPENWGTLEESFQGNEESTVILIQDAHSIPDAQRSIQKLIEHFQTHYGVSLVTLEGAASRLNPQFLKSFPDQELLRKVMEEYREAGELTGVSAAALFGNGPAAFVGIEDWPLYEEGLGYYLRAVEREEEILERLEQEKAECRKQKAEVYPKELMELDEALEKFYEGKGNWVEAVKALKAVGSKQEAGKALRTLMERMDHETPVSVDVEVKRVAEKVKKAVGSRQEAGKAAEKEFNEKYQQYRTSQMTAESFALYLLEWIEKNGLAIDSQRLRDAARGERQLLDVQGGKLFEEFEEYAERVMEALLGSDPNTSGVRPQEEAKALHLRTKHLRLLTRLAKLELSRKEWEALKGLRLDEEGFSEHLAFYENAEKRESAMFQNLTLNLKPKTSNPVILIAGGFHTQGLTERLKQAGISYVLVMPKIEHIPDQTNYREHMKGNVSWKGYFKAEKGRINLYEAFVRGARDRLLGEEGRRQKAEGGKNNPAFRVPPSAFLLKRWRDQIILDLHHQNKIHEAGKYTRFLDEVRATGRSPLRASSWIRDLNPKWFDNVEKFLSGLKHLEAADRLTDANVAKLFQPSTMVGYATANQFVEDSVLMDPKELLRAAEEGKNRRGVRSAGINGFFGGVSFWPSIQSTLPSEKESRKRAKFQFRRSSFVASSSKPKGVPYNRKEKGTPPNKIMQLKSLGTQHTSENQTGQNDIGRIRQDPFPKIDLSVVQHSPNLPEVDLDVKKKNNIKIDNITNKVSPEGRSEARMIAPRFPTDAKPETEFIEELSKTGKFEGKVRKGIGDFFNLRKVVAQVHNNHLIMIEQWLGGGLDGGLILPRMTQIVIRKWPASNLADGAFLAKKQLERFMDIKQSAPEMMEAIVEDLSRTNNPQQVLDSLQARSEARQDVEASGRQAFSPDSTSAILENIIRFAKANKGKLKGESPEKSVFLGKIMDGARKLLESDWKAQDTEELTKRILTEGRIEVAQPTLANLLEMTNEIIASFRSEARQKESGAGLLSRSASSVPQNVLTAATTLPLSGSFVNKRAEARLPEQLDGRVTVLDLPVEDEARSIPEPRAEDQSFWYRKVSRRGFMQKAGGVIAALPLVEGILSVSAQEAPVSSELIEQIRAKGKKIVEEKEAALQKRIPEILYEVLFNRPKFEKWNFENKNKVARALEILLVLSQWNTMDVSHISMGRIQDPQQKRRAIHLGSFEQLRGILKAAGFLGEDLASYQISKLDGEYAEKFQILMLRDIPRFFAFYGLRVTPSISGYTTTASPYVKQGQTPNLENVQYDIKMFPSIALKPLQQVADVNPEILAGQDFVDKGDQFVVVEPIDPQKVLGETGKEWPQRAEFSAGGETGVYGIFLLNKNLRGLADDKILSLEKSKGEEAVLFKDDVTVADVLGIPESGTAENKTISPIWIEHQAALFASWLLAVRAEENVKQADFTKLKGVLYRLFFLLTARHEKKHDKDLRANPDFMTLHLLSGGIGGVSEADQKEAERILELSARVETLRKGPLTVYFMEHLTHAFIKGPSTMNNGTHEWGMYSSERDLHNQMLAFLSKDAALREQLGISFQPALAAVIDGETRRIPLGNQLLLQLYKMARRPKEMDILGERIEGPLNLAARARELAARYPEYQLKPPSQKRSEARKRNLADEFFQAASERLDSSLNRPLPRRKFLRHLALTASALTLAGSLEKRNPQAAEAAGPSKEFTTQIVNRMKELGEKMQNELEAKQNELKYQVYLNRPQFRKWSPENKQKVKKVLEFLWFAQDVRTLNVDSIAPNIKDPKTKRIQVHMGVFLKLCEILKAEGFLGKDLEAYELKAADQTYGEAFQTLLIRDIPRFFAAYGLRVIPNLTGFWMPGEYSASTKTPTLEQITFKMPPFVTYSLNPIYQVTDINPEILRQQDFFEQGDQFIMIEPVDPASLLLEEGAENWPKDTNVMGARGDTNNYGIFLFSQRIKAFAKDKAQAVDNHRQDWPLLSRDDITPREILAGTIDPQTGERRFINIREDKTAALFSMTYMAGRAGGTKKFETGNLEGRIYLDSVISTARHEKKHDRDFKNPDFYALALLAKATAAAGVKAVDIQQAETLLEISARLETVRKGPRSAYFMDQILQVLLRDQRSNENINAIGAENADQSIFDRGLKIIAGNIDLQRKMGLEFETIADGGSRLAQRSQFAVQVGKTVELNEWQSIADEIEAVLNLQQAVEQLVARYPQFRIKAASKPARSEARESSGWTRNILQKEIAQPTQHRLGNLTTHSSYFPREGKQIILDSETRVNKADRLASAEAQPGETAPSGLEPELLPSRGKRSVQLSYGAARGQGNIGIHNSQEEFILNKNTPFSLIEDSTPPGLSAHRAGGRSEARQPLRGGEADGSPRRAAEARMNRRDFLSGTLAWSVLTSLSLNGQSNQQSGESVVSPQPAPKAPSRGGTYDYMKHFAMAMGIDEKEGTAVLNKVFTIGFSFDTWRQVWMAEAKRETDIRRQAIKYYLAGNHDLPSSAVKKEVNAWFRENFIRAREADYRAGHLTPPVFRRLTVPYAPGKEIHGYLVRPAGIPLTQRVPVVHLPHGMMGSKEFPMFNLPEKLLIQNGVAVFRGDLFGHGENDWGVHGADGLDQYIEAPVQFFSEKGEGLGIDGQAQGMMGFSMGGYLTLRAALNPKSHPILKAAVVLNAPVSNFFKDTHFYSDAGWFLDPYFRLDGGLPVFQGGSLARLALTPDDFQRSLLPTAPRIFIHTGKADSTAGLVERPFLEAMFKGPNAPFGQNVRLQINEGHGHYPAMEQQKEIFTQIAAFLVEALKGSKNIRSEVRRVEEKERREGVGIRTSEAVSLRGVPRDRRFPQGLPTQKYLQWLIPFMFRLSEGVRTTSLQRIVSEMRQWKQAESSSQIARKSQRRVARQTGSWRNQAVLSQRHPFDLVQTQSASPLWHESRISVNFNKINKNLKYRQKSSRSEARQPLRGGEADGSPRRAAEARKGGTSPYKVKIQGTSYSLKLRKSSKFRNVDSLSQRSEARALDWKKLDLSSGPLKDFAVNLKDFDLTPENLEFFSVNGTSKPPLLNSLKARLAPQMVFAQAIAAGWFAGMAKRKDLKVPQTGVETVQDIHDIIKMEGDGVAVSLGDVSFQKLADTYGVRIIMAGNEGKRDGSAHLKVLKVYEPQGEVPFTGQTVLAINDSVENTENLLQGRPGSWSFMALYDPDNIYSTDIYRASIIYRAKTRAEGLDPLIRGENTVLKNLKRIAQADGVEAGEDPDHSKEITPAFQSWLGTKHVQLLDRKRHKHILAQLEELKRYGLTYETEEDGDFAPMTLQAAFGVQKNGREVIVMGVGGANEHFAGMSAAYLSKLDASGRKGYGVSRFVRHEKLAQDLSNGDVLHEEEASEFAKLNTEIDERKLPVRKAPQDAAQITAIQNEKELVGGSPAIAAATITGARDFDLAKYREEMPPVQYFKAADGSGKVVVHALLIDDDGDPYLLRLTLSTPNFFRMRFRFFAANSHALENAILYPLIQKMKKIFDKLGDLEDVQYSFVLQAVQEMEEALSEGSSEASSWNPDWVTRGQKERVSEILDNVRSARRESKPFREKVPAYRRELIQIAKTVAEKMMGDPAVETQSGHVSLIASRSEARMTEVERDAVIQTAIGKIQTEEDAALVQGLLEKTQPGPLKTALGETDRKRRNKLFEGKSVEALEELFISLQTAPAVRESFLEQVNRKQEIIQERDFVIRRAIGKARTEEDVALLHALLDKIQPGPLHEVLQKVDGPTRERLFEGKGMEALEEFFISLQAAPEERESVLAQVNRTWAQLAGERALKNLSEEIEAKEQSARLRQQAREALNKLLAFIQESTDIEFLRSWLELITKIKATTQTVLEGENAQRVAELQSRAGIPDPQGFFHALEINTSTLEGDLNRRIRLLQSQAAAANSLQSYQDFVFPDARRFELLGEIKDPALLSLAARVGKNEIPNQSAATGDDAGRLQILIQHLDPQAQSFETVAAFLRGEDVTKAIKYLLMALKLEDNRSEARSASFGQTRMDLDRRDFLKLGGAGAVGTALFGWAQEQDPLPRFKPVTIGWSEKEARTSGTWLGHYFGNDEAIRRAVALDNYMKAHWAGRILPTIRDSFITGVQRPRPVQEQQALWLLSRADPDFYRALKRRDPEIRSDASEQNGIVRGDRGNGLWGRPIVRYRPALSESPFELAVGFSHLGQNAVDLPRNPADAWLKLHRGWFDIPRRLGNNVSAYRQRAFDREVYVVSRLIQVSPEARYFRNLHELADAYVDETFARGLAAWVVLLTDAGVITSGVFSAKKYFEWRAFQNIDWTDPKRFEAQQAARVLQERFEPAAAEQDVARLIDAVRMTLGETLKLKEWPADLLEFEKRMHLYLGQELPAYPVHGRLYLHFLQAVHKNFPKPPKPKLAPTRLKQADLPLFIDPSHPPHHRNSEMRTQPVHGMIPQETVQQLEKVWDGLDSQLERLEELKLQVQERTRLALLGDFSGTQRQLMADISAFRANLLAWNERTSGESVTFQSQIMGRIGIAIGELRQLAGMVTADDEAHANALRSYTTVLDQVAAAQQETMQQLGSMSFNLELGQAAPKSEARFEMPDLLSQRRPVAPTVDGRLIEAADFIVKSRQPENPKALSQSEARRVAEVTRRAGVTAVAKEVREVLAAAILSEQMELASRGLSVIHTIPALARQRIVLSNDDVGIVPDVAAYIDDIREMTSAVVGSRRNLAVEVVLHPGIRSELREQILRILEHHKMNRNHPVRRIKLGDGEEGFRFVNAGLTVSPDWNAVETLTLAASSVPTRGLQLVSNFYGRTNGTRVNLQDREARKALVMGGFELLAQQKDVPWALRSENRYFAKDETAIKHLSFLAALFTASRQSFGRSA